MPDVYENLAKHLDNLPTGFPATESGVELRILKRLFSPEEAEIATGLMMMPEPVAGIAARMEKDPETLAPILEDMSKKGLIFRATKGGQKLYMAAQFVIGIWEYHVNDLDEELIRDVNEYIPHLTDTWVSQKTKQLRVIPVAESLEADMQIMPYEAAESIIRDQIQNHRGALHLPPGAQDERCRLRQTPRKLSGFRHGRVLLRRKRPRPGDLPGRGHGYP